ncbi:MAG: hypothetical protein EYC70_11785 [Planctomycetota bacterium]|nr:MAG: hypothetical protein EYC70_11785 [Planctomycetota bacterium]
MLASRSCALGVAAVLVLVLVLGTGGRAAQQAPAARELSRAQQRFDAAVAGRDAADAALAADYAACEAWVLATADAPAQPPATLRGYLEELGVPAERWPQRRTELAAEAFHVLWNRELYLRSAAAKGYAKAVADLEEAFQALERLRHPERFQRGFAETPQGMALVRGGHSTLGPCSGYILGYPKLAQERSARLQPYYLDQREVTCAEYARFLLAQPRGLREEHLPLGWGMDAAGAPLFPEGAAQVPVTGVSWTSAARYAQWAGKRLPSEDEWEAAAAGTERRRFPMGERFDATRANGRASGTGRARPADDYPADSTPQGIRSMTGNVREWTADLYDEKPGKDRATPVRVAGAYTMAAVRGGSYLDEPDSCASTFRWMEPALGARLPNVGFRCAADVR